jgi:hypothetical protein
MSHNPNDLKLDRLGRVVLSDDVLDRLRESTIILAAGGANDFCTNAECGGTTNNWQCSNGHCDGSTNPRTCADGPIG